MKLKLYTNDDVLAGELTMPSGAVLFSNRNQVTKALMDMQSKARRHERGDPPESGSNGGQSTVIDKSWPGNRYHLIGKPILEGINRYVLTHQPVGHFLTAVLTNDLRTAFGRADPDNRQILHDIVGYCYNEIPSVCQGSAAKHKVWLEMEESKWPDVTAPETDKEIKRQDAAGIWGVTKFKEVKP